MNTERVTRKDLGLPAKQNAPQGVEVGTQPFRNGGISRVGLTAAVLKTVRVKARVSSSLT